MQKYSRNIPNFELKHKKGVIPRPTETTEEIDHILEQSFTTSFRRRTFYKFHFTRGGGQSQHTIFIKDTFWAILGQKWRIYVFLCCIFWSGASHWVHLDVSPLSICLYISLYIYSRVAYFGQAPNTESLRTWPSLSLSKCKILLTFWKIYSSDWTTRHSASAVKCAKAGMSFSHQICIWRRERTFCARNASSWTLQGMEM